jgi:hypothetical protein
MSPRTINDVAQSLTLKSKTDEQDSSRELGMKTPHEPCRMCRIMSPTWSRFFVKEDALSTGKNWDLLSNLSNVYRFKVLTRMHLDSRPLNECPNPFLHNWKCPTHLRASGVARRLASKNFKSQITIHHAHIANQKSQEQKNKHAYLHSY